VKVALGIDYGTSKIGLAIYYKANDIYLPLKTIKNSKDMLEELRHIITEYRIDSVVVGVPNKINNELNAKVIAFAKRLASSFKGGVYLVNEDNSTLYAKDMLLYSSRPTKAKLKLKNEGSLDSFSAVEILKRLRENNALSSV